MHTDAVHQQQTILLDLSTVNISHAEKVYMYACVYIIWLMKWQAHRKPKAHPVTSCLEVHAYHNKHMQNINSLKLIKVFIVKNRLMIPLFQKI